MHADALTRILSVVSDHEGDAWSTNANTDGAGLSWGILQWTQASGELGKLLARMHKHDPQRFAAAFGAASAELLDATAAAVLAPVAGEPLWGPAWLPRFQAAGRDLVWQAVQREHALSGAHWRGAVKAAQQLGVSSERAMAVLFDGSVNQGPGRTDRAVRDTLASFGAVGDGRTERQVLEVWIAWVCSGLKSRTEPTSSPGSKKTWRQVGNEWHVHLGNTDLWERATWRKRRLLDTPDLQDTSIPVQVA